MNSEKPRTAPPQLSLVPLETAVIRIKMALQNPHRIHETLARIEESKKVSQKTLNFQFII